MTDAPTVDFKALCEEKDQEIARLKAKVNNVMGILQDAGLQLQVLAANSKEKI